MGCLDWQLVLVDGGCELWSECQLFRDLQPKSNMAAVM